MARNYTHERLIEKPERVKERAERNRARAVLKEKVGEEALKGKDVHHRDGRTSNNNSSNLKAVNPSAHNHGRKGAQGGKLKKG